MAQAAQPLIFSSPALIDPAPVAGSGNELSGVSCSSAELCVAVDEQGNVVTATDPTGTWTPANVDATGLSAVSCTTAPL
ncbi:MAG TPA: hypothetical protein VIJ20_13615, partial [Solirubrobacteraceae bacterium]